MGRRRTRKRKPQQPAFKPRLPNQATVVPVLIPNRNLNPLPVRVTRFLAPHQQQESMVELSDDTSPNTPLIVGGWKPLQAASTAPATIVTPEIKITRQEQIWREFKDTLAKPIHKISDKSKEEKPVTAGQNIKPAQITKPALPKPADPKPPQTSNEIKWELNVLDEKEDVIINLDSPERKVPEPTPTPAVDIKLQLKEKTIIQAPKREESTSVGNPRVSVPRESSQPPPLYTNQKSKDEALARMYMAGLHPKGVPRSFLRQQQNIGSIEPQCARQGTAGGLNAFSAPPGLYEGPGLHINTAQPAEPAEVITDEQQYSPSDVYDDMGRAEEAEGSLSPSGQKRLSAFQRLGPVSQPKKPKLTINLMCNQDQSVREVLENEVETYTPVHLRKDVLESCDETVMKYLPFWPWKRHITARKKVTARNSKSVMILELEQMEEHYEKDNIFVQVSVKGYPRFWKKEHVLDVILDAVKGKSFIPCFIEFTAEECKFLVIRCRSALVAIHKLGFYIRKDDVELAVSVNIVDVSLNQVEFIPRLVLRKQLAIGYDGERKLSLKEFTLKSDVSHFIYFPLNRVTNQSELVQLQSTIAWDFLTDLDLSHNRITSIDGLELPKTTPKLKNLDLSYNWIDKVTCLIHNKDLSLRTLRLEGNPLCHDYIDPSHYVRVVKMIFPALTELDGVQIHLKGDLPPKKRNYCPSDAVDVANKFLDVFFPLLEAPPEERSRIEHMYDDKAVLTVTYRHGLRYSGLFRKFRNIFLRARVFEDGDPESVDGAPSIARLLCKWPMMFHDPFTFTVDIIHHNEFSTILRVDGVLKLTSEILAEDEHLLSFTRTVVLNSIDGIEYKILNEMMYWDEPSREIAINAFQFSTIRTSKRLSLKFDSPPDEDLKAKLTEIFMQVSGLDKRSSEKCLELKEWNLKASIEYFMKLLKLDDLNSLRKELEDKKDL